MFPMRCVSADTIARTKCSESQFESFLSYRFFFKAFIRTKDDHLGSFGKLAQKIERAALSRPSEISGKAPDFR